MAIAIVGTGLIGQAWAIVFARAGHDVRLWDGDHGAAERARDLIARQAKMLCQAGLVENDEALLGRVGLCRELGQALGEDTQYVQENLPERLDVKQHIFQEMDALAPAHTLLASSTSSIPASQFTEKLPGRARCLVAHPVNPPYLIPLVELCGAPWTSGEVLGRAREILRAAGQKPVIIHHGLKGFVLNRLQGALLREAFRLVESGSISVEDLDTTVKDGLGLRWSFMGPFETIDLNAPAGVRDYCKRYGQMYAEIGLEQTDAREWGADLVARVEHDRREQLPAEELQERRLWRDQQLMALALHKRHQQS